MNRIDLKASQRHLRYHEGRLRRDEKRFWEITQSGPFSFRFCFKARSCARIGLFHLELHYTAHRIWLCVVRFTWTTTSWCRFKHPVQPCKIEVSSCATIAPFLAMIPTCKSDLSSGIHSFIHFHLNHLISNGNLWVAEKKKIKRYYKRIQLKLLSV